MAQVRYIVDDVDATVEFYVSKRGFELQDQFGPAIATWQSYVMGCGTSSISV